MSGVCGRISSHKVVWLAAPLSRVHDTLVARTARAFKCEALEAQTELS